MFLVHLKVCYVFIEPFIYLFLVLAINIGRLWQSLFRYFSFLYITFVKSESKYFINMEKWWSLRELCRCSQLKGPILKISVMSQPRRYHVPDSLDKTCVQDRTSSEMNILRAANNVTPAEPPHLLVHCWWEIKKKNKL